MQSKKWNIFVSVVNFISLNTVENQVTAQRTLIYLHTQRLYQKHILHIFQIVGNTVFFYQQWVLYYNSEGIFFIYNVDDNKQARLIERLINERIVPTTPLTIWSISHAASEKKNKNMPLFSSFCLSLVSTSFWLQGLGFNRPFFYTFVLCHTVVLEI